MKVLVTGAASGLGAALVRRFTERGDQVLATDLAELVAVPAGATYRRLDVRSLDDWLAARAWTEAIWGGLDALVNNAGVASGGRIDVAGIDEWERTVDVNLLGVARGCHVFAPLLKRNPGSQLVNIASMAGLVHPPAMGAYNATKAGVVALSETLSHELGPFGVSVTVVCPSFFRSGLAASLCGADVVAVSSARRLIDGSTMDADAVAGRVVDAMDARRFLIFTDVQGRAAFVAKRFARPVYQRTMRRISRSFHRRACSSTTAGT